MTNLLKEVPITTTADGRGYGPAADTITANSVSVVNITFTGTINGLSGGAVTPSAPQTLSNKFIQDTNCWFVGTADATKAIKFNTTTATTNASLTLQSSLTTNRTYNFPDVGSAADFVLTAGTQTIGGAKTFSSTVTTTQEYFSTKTPPSVNSYGGRLVARSGTTTSDVAAVIGAYNYNGIATRVFFSAVDGTTTAFYTDFFMQSDGVGDASAGKIYIGYLVGSSPPTPRKVNVLGSIYASTGFYTAGPLSSTQTIITVDTSDTAPESYLARGSTDNNKRIAIGYNTTTNYGVIQAYNGVAVGTNLSLQPVAGNVAIGATDALGNKLYISGNVFSTDSITSRKAAASMSYGGIMRASSGATAGDHTAVIGTYNNGTNTGAVLSAINGTETVFTTLYAQSDGIGDASTAKFSIGYGIGAAPAVPRKVNVLGSIYASTGFYTDGTVTTSDTFTSTKAAASMSYGGIMRARTGTTAGDFTSLIGTYNNGTNTGAVVSAINGNETAFINLYIQSDNAGDAGTGKAYFGYDVGTTPAVPRKVNVLGSVYSSAGYYTDSIINTGDNITATKAITNGTYGPNIISSTGTTGSDSQLHLTNYNNGGTNVCFIRALSGIGGFVPLHILDLSSDGSGGTLKVGYAASTSVGGPLPAATFVCRGSINTEQNIGSTGYAQIGLTSTSNTLISAGDITSTKAITAGAFGPNIISTTGTTATDSALVLTNTRSGSIYVPIIRGLRGDGAGVQPLHLLDLASDGTGGTVLVGFAPGVGTTGPITNATFTCRGSINTDANFGAQGYAQIGLTSTSNVLISAGRITARAAALSGAYGGAIRASTGTTVSDCTTIIGPFNTGSATGCVIGAINGNETAYDHLYIQQDGAGDGGPGKVSIGYVIGTGPATPRKLNISGSVNVSSNIYTNNLYANPAVSNMRIETTGTTADSIWISGGTGADNANPTISVYGTTSVGFPGEIILSNGLSTVRILPSVTTIFEGQTITVNGPRIVQTLSGSVAAYETTNTTDNATTRIELKRSATELAQFTYTHSTTDANQYAAVTVGTSNLMRFTKGNAQVTLYGGIQLANSTTAAAGNVRYTANRADIYTDNTTANWKRVPQIRSCYVTGDTVTPTVSNNYGFNTSVTRNGAGDYTITLSEDWGVFSVHVNSNTTVGGIVINAQGLSNTAIRVRQINMASVPQDESFYIMVAT